MNSGDSRSSALVVKTARELFEQEPNALLRWSQIYRPAICPLDDAIEQIPRGASVLDVGCGAGLFLLLLARLGRIGRGFGFDVSERAITAARAASRRAALDAIVSFEARSIERGIPEFGADTLTAIDVLHHVPPLFQRDFVADLYGRLPPGGTLFIKDMVTRPRWRAVANGLHDLLLARQLVHHVDPDMAENWLRSMGGEIQRRRSENRMWYGHWSLTVRKPRSA